jgi:hypothetical protein
MSGLTRLLGKSLSGAGGYCNTGEFSDEVGVPVLAPKLAVGHDVQTDLLLHAHDLADSSVFDFPELALAP